MIPKIIHQIWLGDQSKRPTELINTWKEVNPDWEHKLWTEENIPELRCQAQFDALDELAGKADILRYEILFNEGGFYIDADSRALEPLDDFFLDNDSFCCYENETTREGLLANGYLGSIKGCKLIDMLLNVIEEASPEFFKTLPHLMAWQVVGPMLLTNTVHDFAYDDIKIYPSHWFIPKHYSGISYEGSDKIYCEQYYMSTPPSGRSYEEFRS